MPPGRGGPGGEGEESCPCAGLGNRHTDNARLAEAVQLTFRAPTWGKLPHPYLSSRRRSAPIRVMLFGAAWERVNPHTYCAAQRPPFMTSEATGHFGWATHRFAFCSVVPAGQVSLATQRYSPP